MQDRGDNDNQQTIKCQYQAHLQGQATDGDAQAWNTKSLSASMIRPMVPPV